jgi:hypothetical protein
MHGNVPAISVQDSEYDKVVVKSGRALRKVPHSSACVTLNQLAYSRVWLKLRVRAVRSIEESQRTTHVAHGYANGQGDDASSNGAHRRCVGCARRHEALVEVKGGQIA